MNREIKFRAWDKKAKQIKTFGMLKAQYNTLDCLSYDFLIPMQYTGLKDKNGKEIYEGDIVKGKRYFPIGDGSNERVISDKGIICYDKLGLLTINTSKFNKNTCYSDFFGSIELSDCNFEIEVLGNIYENPELLEDN